MKRQYVLAVLSACMFSLAGCGSVVTLNSTAKETQAQETEMQEIEMQEIEMQEIKMQEIATPEENSALQDSLQNVAKKNESSVKLATKTFADATQERYEYYLTKEELLADVAQGIIFRVDTAFQKPMCPIVNGGNWPFYVHEDNVVNLEISYSNLISKTSKTFYPYGEKVCVDVLSPDGETAYHFEKLYDEIMQDTSIQEQIAVTPGEWTLKISFAYVCDEAWSHFKVCASYESPSEEDINWLRKARLREHDAGIRPETKGGAADFELTDDGKKFLEYICNTVNDFERTDEKDEAFWRDFLFLAYTGLWEDKAEIVKVPRADLGFDEPVVKVSLEEAQAYARLVFGEELPDLKPAFEEMKERQTSFFFADGYYYIGTSDFPDFQFHFDDCTVYEEEGSVYAVAQYGIDFEGASNVGTVRLTLVPAENENGFVLIEKERAFVSGF
ncbi:MAG: hypothetical protein HFH79_04240 [Lachnospiraceae bacterium]|nr:hypothetical protein [Lachnospiraceae bacterium]